MPHRARVGLARRLLPDEEIVSMYLSGVDAESVGYRGGCSAGTVLKLVRAAGHSPRGRGGIKSTLAGTLPPEELVRLYQTGLSIDKVAARACCSTHVVRKAIIAAGIPFRRPGDHMRKAKPGGNPRKFTRQGGREPGDG